MDDVSAIEKCLSGDRDAFRYLVERYQREALAHAASILNSREEGRDAVQEAFWEAYRMLDRFELDRPFYPWFYSILRHRCYKLLSARRSQLSISLEENLGEPVTRPDSPYQILVVRQALTALTGEEREILMLRHFSGLSYEELATRLQIPSGTVMSRLFYARKKLGKYLSVHSGEHQEAK